jgi:hypothetical protein
MISRFIELLLLPDELLAVVNLLLQGFRYHICGYAEPFAIATLSIIRR